MVQKIGAQLWHMNAQASVLGFKPAEFETGFAITLRKPGFIYVDRYGNRFLDETRLEAHEAGVATSEFDTRTYTYSRLPCYVIMDEENARGKCLCLSIFSFYPTGRRSAYNGGEPPRAQWLMNPGVSTPLFAPFYFSILESSFILGDRMIALRFAQSPNLHCNSRPRSRLTYLLTNYE